MIKIANKKLIVALEIGTTKISTLIGEIIENNIAIIGIGYSVSKGINNSGINDLESIIQCIKQSVSQAEKMSGCQINSVYLSISNKNINCINEIGMVPISTGEVTAKDIMNVIYTAQYVRIKNKHHILHVIPQEYIIDQQYGIKNPIGMSGMRMEAKVHVITCHKDISNNFVKAVTTCGIKVDQLIFSGLASSQSTLTQEEIDIGVCLVDIGGGTIDLTIYNNGMIIHSQVIPYAGNIITNDISHAFSLTLKEAEFIKINYGTLKQNIDSSNEGIKIPNQDNLSTIKHLTQKKLLEVIKPRYLELLKMIHEIILSVQNKHFSQESTLYKIRSGIVFTGGGSKINSLIKCAKKIFQTNVRIASPSKTCFSKNNISKPEYSTTAGLLIYGKKKFLQQQRNIPKKKSFKFFLHKINNWFRKEF